MNGRSSSSSRRTRRSSSSRDLPRRGSGASARAWGSTTRDGTPTGIPCETRARRSTCGSRVPAYERVVDLAGGGDLAARMLSLYRPPPYLAACSQGAWRRGGQAVLVRNYDCSPSRFEGLIWSTRLSERRVVGMSDCLWGLL